MTVGYTSKAYPAELSDFRLDTYEITVGRFRKFVAAYSQTMIAAGAGKNPNNPSDPGWVSAWNASLPANVATLTGALKCTATFQTWTDSAGSAAAESLPIDCLGWYEAEAFCIWDGGRLPTEAEWNYAASGGTKQRLYPWGSAAPDCTYANYYGADAGNDYCVLPGVGSTSRVGATSPKGDGKFGQADLGGNVWEWVQDLYVSPYSIPTCDNCSDLTSAAIQRVTRGGSFYFVGAYMLSSNRDDSLTPLDVSNGGARCARSAP